jgi:serine protease AprX
MPKTPLRWHSEIARPIDVLSTGGFTMGNRSLRWTMARLTAVAVTGAIVPALAMSGSASATLNVGTLSQLLSLPTIHVQPDLWGDSTADASSEDANGNNDPTKDPGSLYTVTKAIGARSLWSSLDSGGKAITGQGVTVAVLDSGVANVEGLNGTGKVVYGPDLSLETNSPTLQGVDTFGHGTHLSGIIGAADPTSVNPITGALNTSNPSSEFGVAPGAKILAVKVATTDGSTDISEVIAGLDWIAEHRNDNGMNVRVVNLSFGTDSVQSYQIDPLAAAAENAWRHGIVVVVSGGNEGQSAGRLTDPAMDPYVIAVGASASSTVGGWSNPTVAPFSSSGTAVRHVDLVAPGTSIASLRNPGSYIDTNYPSGLVAGDSTGRLFRGSGSSQAAAVVSGAVALLEQQDPAITPDQVKAALVDTANPMSASAVDAGAGELNVAAASKMVALASISKLTASLVFAGSTQVFPVATGTGSLDAARGGNYLVDPDTGAVLSGEVDVQGQAWNGAAWDAASVAGTAWSGGSWLGTVWTGAGWVGNRWTSSAWTSNRWSGISWSATSWTSNRWSSNRWSSNRWSGANW